MSNKQKKAFGKMAHDQRVEELVGAYLDDTATAEQRSELSDLIVESAEVCDFFIAQVVARQSIACRLHGSGSESAVTSAS